MIIAWKARGSSSAKEGKKSQRTLYLSEKVPMHSNAKNVRFLMEKYLTCHCTYGRLSMPLAHNSVIGYYLRIVLNMYSYDLEFFLLQLLSTIQFNPDSIQIQFKFGSDSVQIRFTLKVPIPILEGINFINLII
ncbi:hypothetical protein VN97_g11204 [Penicillium thymicola]|uniref:Uncharacterized protein n=1 Tax=Penicillium thymicola TaxID=293382 RepID=A0AAI9T8M6_PENTH|nr:hypothetical protein VN97_g11204 [Penicillium thymicola]